MKKTHSIRQKQIKINTYQELYDFVKNVKRDNNLDLDTLEIIDGLIYKWFSRNGVKALDTCYSIFNDIIKSNKNFIIKLEDKEIKAEW